MELANITTELIIFLCAIAVLAGLLDTLAGGGGLITLPALMLAGVPAAVALGTNKLQGAVGTATSSFIFLRKGLISWKTIRLAFVLAFIGATCGSVAVQYINKDILGFVVPSALFFIILYFAFPIKFKEQSAENQSGRRKWYNFSVPAIGVYDGMFGPGTGSFFTLSSNVFQGDNLISSTAKAKLLNFSTNLSALIIFITYGNVAFGIGVLMMVGQVLGAWLGAKILVRIKEVYLRALVIFMSTAMLILYLLKS